LPVRCTCNRLIGHLYSSYREDPATTLAPLRQCCRRMFVQHIGPALPTEGAPPGDSPSLCDTYVTKLKLGTSLAEAARIRQGCIMDTPMWGVVRVEVLKNSTLTSSGAIETRIAQLPIRYTGTEAPSTVCMRLSVSLRSDDGTEKLVVSGDLREQIGAREPQCFVARSDIPLCLLMRKDDEVQVKVHCGLSTGRRELTYGRSSSSFMPVSSVFWTHNDEDAAVPIEFTVVSASALPAREIFETAGSHATVLAQIKAAEGACHPHVRLTALKKFLGDGCTPTHAMREELFRGNAEALVLLGAT